MKTRQKYLIMIVVCIVLCTAIVITNYVDYIQGKSLVVNEIEPERKITYSESYERASRTDTVSTININTASAQELADFLPGIGIVKAESIVAYREAIGGFKSVEELIEVKGIGEATMNSIREYCRVSDD